MPDLKEVWERHVAKVIAAVIKAGNPDATCKDYFTTELTLPTDDPAVMLHQRFVTPISETLRCPG